MSDITWRLDTRKLDDLIANLPGKLDAMMRGVAQEMTNDVIVSFNTSPPGRTYTRGGVTHVASAPGYPPNVDTGALRASVHWQVAGRLHYQIMDGVEYGYWLEVGTEAIQPRPFMTPVFEEWKQRRFMQYVASNPII